MKQQALVSGQAVAAMSGQLQKESGSDRTLPVQCLLGLLLPRLTVWGIYAPFGIGLVAAIGGRGALLVGLCTAVGYVLRYPATEALLYVLSVVLAVGVQGILRLFTDKLHPIWHSIIAAGAAITAGILRQEEELWSVSGLTLLVAGGLLAGGFCAVCVRTAAALLREPQAVDRLAWGILAAATLTAAGTVTIGGFTPGRIVSLTAIMLVSRAGRDGDGVALGTACSLFTLLCTPTALHTAFTPAAVGLLGGAYARFGRVAQALVTLSVSALFHAASGDGELLVMGIYEALVAGILLFIFPAAWEERLRRWLCRSEESSLIAAWQLRWHNRLTLASGTVAQMAQTVEAVSEKLTGLSGPALSDVYTGLSQSVCRHCPRRMVCWSTQFDVSMEACNSLTEQLRARGRVTEEELPSAFASCPQREAVARHISDGFSAYRLREGAFARLSELRRGVNGQLEEVSALLAEWAAHAEEAVNMEPTLARYAREVCAGNGYTGAEVSCFRLKDGGLRLQLWLPEGAKSPTSTLCEELSEVCRQPFGEPVICHAGGCTCISLCPPPHLRVHVGIAQHSSGGQALCGDAVETLTDGAGRVITLLCDGMGSGGRAAVDGTMCATLTSRLLAAGFGEESTLRLVNTALMVRAGEESLSTLDLLAVDVYSGTLVSRKAGAAASLLYSGGRVSRIEQTSLPVGILREVAFADYRDRLVAGDVVLMVSDGVYLGGSGWVEELLSSRAAACTPQALAQEVVEEACRRAPAGREDDVTAVVLSIARADA